MVLLAVAASFCGQLAYGGARPVIGVAFEQQIFDSKSVMGQDGLYRVLFDYNPAKGHATSTYSGSALWILNPNGSLVAAGSPTIPASVGATYLDNLTYNGAISFPYERSNTVLFVEADGNTTILFYYNLGSGAPVTSFGTWTYNSSGSLIAASSYGPYSGLTVGQLLFAPNGKIVVNWTAGPAISTVNAGWVLDEYGTISSATGYYGPYTGAKLGKILVNSSNQQVWTYRATGPGGTYFLNTLTFNSSGSAIVNALSFGPF
jgi:hypothetical protein